MFKKKPKPEDKQKAKELKRVHKNDDLEKAYELAQEIVNDQQTPAESKCCKILWQKQILT